ncbi:hypothetical protein [uncultured Vibrio sp.]|uniref:hypothetical protein n=1 Tax=uncultured Vibrio sp. TaxID=114054 RepID=UPI002615B65C|nr:hypothetical protein [uncultured Vibrio sp.]
MFSKPLRFSFTLVLLFLFHSFANAESETQSAKKESTKALAEKTGSELFSHYVKDDVIPSLAISSFIEHKHMVAHVVEEEVIDGEVVEKDLFVTQKTDDRGNLRVHVKYPQQYEKDQKSYTRSTEAMVRTQYKLRQFARSYDPESVEVVQLKNGLDLIRFRYSKFGLPQDIAYFRFMEVEIVAKEGHPISITVTNNQSFEYRNSVVEEYKQVLSFAPNSLGHDVMVKKHITALGKTRKGNKDYSLSVTVTPVKYVNKQDQIEILNDDELASFNDKNLIEKEIKLTSALPLLGDAVRRQGIDLPLPYGVSFVYRNQDMNFGLNDISIMNQSLNSLLEPGSTSAKVTAETVGIRGDVYLLPFLNIYGMVGKLNIDADVHGEYNGELGNAIRDKLNNKLPQLGDAFCNGLSALCQSGTIDIPLSLSYDVLSVGTTLAVGYRNLFASATASYSMTRLEGEDQWGDPIVSVQPMIGYNWVDYRTQLFVGMEYQFIKPYFRGEVSQIEIGGEPFSYDVGANLAEAAYMVGLNKELGRNYMLTFLYNKGETRNSVTLNMGYRF